MFEFIDSKIVVASVFAMIAIALLEAVSDKKKKESVFNIKWIYLLLLFLPLVEAYSSYDSGLEMKEKFLDGATLKCHIEEFTYLVSKEEKWKIKSSYFTKESLLISADRCEEME